MYFKYTCSDFIVFCLSDKVLITPMKRMVVPPPMSAYELQLPCAVNQVMFAPPPFTNDLAVVLVDGRIAVYRLKSGEV